MDGAGLRPTSFASILLPMKLSRSSKDDTEETLALRAAFDVFDVDKNGLISAEELQRVIRSLGDKNTSLAECRHNYDLLRGKRR